MSLPKPYYEEPGITIYHGDCREILPLLPKVDLVLTDPPYGILKGTRSSAMRRLHHNATDGSIEWDIAIDTLMCCALKESGIHVMIWGGNHFNLGPTNGWLIWDKQNDGRNFGECEYCWTNMVLTPRIHREWCVNIDGSRQHPTQKPVKLMKWCIKKTNGVGTILDPFMGSGTTLRAAKDLGRQAIGIEIEEKYCEIAVKRLAQEVLAL